MKRCILRAVAALLFVCSGMSSSQIPNPTFIQEGRGATPRTVTSKLLEQAVSVLDFGAYKDGTHGTETRAAIVAALSARQKVYVPEGTYLIAGPKIDIPAGRALFGDGVGNMQTLGTTFKRAAGDYTTFFSTDSSSIAYTGITLANFKISGGGSSTWADVQNKWAIESHYPFTRIVGVQIEGDDHYFGNGIRLHNDGGQPGMGAWMSELDNVRFVGTDGSQPADNSSIGLDLKINGGNIRVTNSNFAYTNVGIHVRRGENFIFQNVHVNNIRAGAPTARTKAAVIIGEANAAGGLARVRGVVFNGYMEAVGRAFLIQNTVGVTINGGYYNAFRGYSPSGGSDGFVYMTKTGEGVIIDGADIETQYNLPNVILSEGPALQVRGGRLFLNVTNASGVPQTYYGGGIGVSDSGVSPRRSLVDVLTIKLTSKSASVPVSNSAASGSLVLIYAPRHGLSTGDYVWIEGMLGMTAANGALWQVTKVDANSIALNGSLFSGTYKSGGTIWKPTARRETSIGFDTNHAIATVFVDKNPALSSTWHQLVAVGNVQAWEVTAFHADVMTTADSAARHSIIYIDAAGGARVRNVDAYAGGPWNITYRVNAGYIEFSQDNPSSKRIAVSARRLF